jgi:hypothetical protein
MRLYNKINCEDLSIINIKRNMDYQEWLLNQYVVKVASMTYSDSWKKWVAYITAGTLIFTFANVARLWVG